ncbi:MAG: serine protease AprX [Frankiales bacterium]|nr:serine protease AprX [Frankiales bacterium]
MRALQAPARLPRRSAALLLGAAMLAAMLPGVLPASGDVRGPVAVIDSALTNARGTAHIIVQAAGTSAGAAKSAAIAVERAGGRVTTDLPIIHGFAAEVPAVSLQRLAHTGVIRAITADSRVHVQAAPTTDPVWTLPSVHRQVVGADRLVSSGADGHGVTVALIDTGVTSMGDIADRLVPVANDALGQSFSPCINFSGEATCDDTYGHGTFVAGLIAGSGAASDGQYAGAAPGARILSVKLSGADGSADVSKLLAALQWVVSFRNVYNIKVLNLSVGTDSTQSYRIDPLNYAVEQAWKAGITVVVAASNRGPGPATITKPADDPFVITVGASDDNLTVNRNDDAIPAFSSHGPTAADGLAKPDVLAPGSHVVSLAAPDSAIGIHYPPSMAAPYRSASGTSFATPIVAGLVADMLSGNPFQSPDRIKFALMSTARSYAGADPMAQGAGLVDGYAAKNSAPLGYANQGVPSGLGTGSLDASRGTVRVEALGSNGSVVLNGNVTAQLTAYNPTAYLTSAWTSANWWLSQWTGTNWSGTNWSGTNWSGVWNGTNWSGTNWSGTNWSNGEWYGTNWSGGAWYGAWDQ